MESALKKLTAFLKANWYVIVIIGVGVFLLLLPFGTNEGEEPLEKTPQTRDLQQELTQILSQIQGVGDVQVLLTVAEGERFVYQTDENGTSIDTVIVSDENRVESGLICQVIPPSYRGAIIVCQGADRPEVQLRVVEAVSKVTGLGSDRITVLKMK
jgi:stage III sporulation protein AG